MTSFARQHRIAPALLFAIVILAYSSGVRGSFIWDDNFQIVRNPYVHSLEPITRIFTTDVWGFMRPAQTGSGNYYRPLQIVAYRWTAALWGLRPAAFHCLSLMLNWLACCAAYGVFFQLTKRFHLALAASAIFAVHPIHSEAVLWIAAASELGCALFYFASFWMFLRSEEPQFADRKLKPRELRQQQSRRRKMLTLSCLAFFLALLWKEMALTLPLVVIAYIAILGKTHEGWKARLRAGFARSLPFFGIVALYAAIRVSVLGHFAAAQTPWTLTPVQYGFNVAELAAEYCLRLVAPIKLNAYHVFHPVLSPGDLRLIGSVIFLSAAAWLLFLAKRHAPLAAFAGAWIFLTLVPALYLSGVGLNVFAERYLYIPSFGFVLLITWAGAEWLKKLPPATRQRVGILMVAVGSIAAIAEVRNRVPDWHDELTLYTRTIQASPDAAQIRSALAQDLSDAGDLKGAEGQYRAALDAALAQQAKAQIANAYLGLAFIAARKQQYEPALELVNRGLTYLPLETLQLQKGLLLLQLGHVDEARNMLAQIVRYFPYDSVALNGLGVIAQMQNDNDRAISYFQQAVQFNPLFGDGYNNLGRSFLAAGRTDAAIESFRRATEVQPSNPLFWTNYAIALSQAGRSDEARLMLRRAQELQPRNSASR